MNSENMVSIAHTIHNKEPCSHDSTRDCMQVAWILAAWRFGCTLSVLSTLRIFTAPGLIECHAASSSDARMYACSARWAFFVSTPFRLSATGRYIYEQMEKVVVPRAPENAVQGDPSFFVVQMSRANTRTHTSSTSAERK